MRWAKNLPNLSLRLRLSLLFGLLVLAAWLAAAMLIWAESRETIDEFFDTQLMMFAKTLALADLGALPGQALELPSTRSLVPDKRHRGEEDDDAMAFAVFARDGRLILSDGDKGGLFPFRPEFRGFADTRLGGRRGASWRIVWLEGGTGGFVVAVGQELAYRRDMALDMMQEQILPGLYILPLLLLGMILLLGRELAPLRAVARDLETRAPDDAAPVPEHKLPGELRPLVVALNRLFARIGALLARERAFVADAAHELRTPLTALRVQAEVAHMADDDPCVRQNALVKLVQGIDRSNRLVEQLLALSRLDVAEAAPKEGAGEGAGQAAPPLAWRAVLKDLLEAGRPRFEDKGIALSLALPPFPPFPPDDHGGLGAPGSFDAAWPLRGKPETLSLLLRNVLDNALNYTPPGGEVRVSLRDRVLEVANTGPGVPEDCMPRLGERFFRPPGQSQAGSGLGLSIAGRAAAALGLSLELGNTADGFAVRLRLP